VRSPKRFLTGAVICLLAASGIARGVEREAEMKPTLKRDGDKVWITGMEKLEWPKDQENSVMRCLAIAMRTVGETNFSYQYLMGVSGAAFRIQLNQENWCPSSPHAHCGFNCGDVAVASMPYRVQTFDFFDEKRKNDPAAKAEAWRAVVASIDRGEPAIFGSEENGLVVGYAGKGETLLGRSYLDRKEPGFCPITKLPWFFGVFEKREQPPDRRTCIIESLKLAVKLANTESFEKYDSGWKAYERWIRELRVKDVKSEQQGNACIFLCLWDARREAAGYLKSIAAEFASPAREHLQKAAALYAEIAVKLNDPCPLTIAPFPGKPWTQEMRNKQANALDACQTLERQAVAEIGKALAAISR
jgi:hypothetical protein